MKFDDARQSVRLFRYFFAAYPVRSTLMLLALTAAALSEGVGFAALLPLIGLVTSAEGAGGALTFCVELAFAWVGLELSLGGLPILIVVMIALKTLPMLLAMAKAMRILSESVLDRFEGSLVFCRSIFAIANIAEGAVLTDASVRIMRPDHGLPPKHLPDVLGQRTTRAISCGTPIS